MRKGNPHFEYLLCIENGFVKCLGEGKDDPMISKVDHWLSTCYKKKRMERTPSVATCLLKS